MIAGTQRGDDAFVPAADDRIDLGDTILVVGRADHEDSLHKIFGARS